MNTRQSDETTKKDSSLQVSRVRRKLLKISATAPLVAGLTPNAVVAATSITSCQPLNGAGVSNAHIDGNGNSWNGDDGNALRVVLHSWSTNANGNGGTGRVYLTTPSEIMTQEDGNSLVNGGYSHREIMIGDTLKSLNGPEVTVNNTNISDYSNHTYHALAEVLVIFQEQDGTFVLANTENSFFPYETNGGDSFALSTSCVSSLVANYNQNL